MSSRRSSDKIFMDGTIKTVAEIGIENMRTKHIAEYADFTAATIFRRFSSKNILLRDTFLNIDKNVSNILTQSSFICNPDETPFEIAIYAIWRRIYRYLIDHRDETLFLIRYRYSSLYTDEVRNMRQAYCGGFDHVDAVFENHFGKLAHSYREFFMSCIFEMTLVFAEKVVTGRIEDNQQTEDFIWLAISSIVKSLTQKQGGSRSDDRQGTAETQQTRSA